MKRFSISLLMFLWLTCLVAAEESLQPQPQNIFVEVQVVAIPQATALPLVRDLKDASKAETAYKQIQDLLVNGTAKLIDWPMVITHSGNRAVVEAVNEFRYATEFDPGGVGVYFEMKEREPVRELVKQPSEISGVDLNAVPKSFETRNVGVTLEVEPTLSPDQKTITLNIVPQHTRLKAMNKVTVEIEKTHQKVAVEQPEFDNKRVTTSLTVKNGEHVLLGIFRTAEPADHLELFILKAEVRQTQ